MLLDTHVNVMDKKNLSSLWTCSYSVYPETSCLNHNLCMLISELLHFFFGKRTVSRCLPGQASASWLPRILMELFLFWGRNVLDLLSLPACLISDFIVSSLVWIRLHLQAFAYVPADFGSFSSSAGAEEISIHQAKNRLLHGHVRTKILHTLLVRVRPIDQWDH